MDNNVTIRVRYLLMTIFGHDSSLHVHIFGHVQSNHGSRHAKREILQMGLSFVYRLNQLCENGARISLDLLIADNLAFIFDL